MLVLVIFQGEEIIVVIPWDEWWELALKDSSNPQIALLPLHPDVRAKFNSTAAWEYARSMSGKPYGYHNMIFSWIDTIADNYPPPLDAHLVCMFDSLTYQKNVHQFVCSFSYSCLYHLTLRTLLRF